MSSVKLEGVEEAHSSDAASSETEYFSQIDYIDVNFSLSKFVPRPIFRDSLALTS